jgi:hypothetical protein
MEDDPQIKNSDRSTKNTIVIIASIFPRILKHNNKTYVDGNLLNTEEAWKYQKAFFPSKEHIQKHLPYIKDYVLVRDNHEDIEKSESGERPAKPIGWVEDVWFSEKPQYSDNPRLYYGLIAKIRIPIENAEKIMDKYDQTSLYAFSFSICYEPIAVNLKNPKTGEEKTLVTDIKVKEFSLTLDPAYRKCRTVSIFSNKYVKKKKYIVYWSGDQINKVSIEMEDETMKDVEKPNDKNLDNIQNNVTKPLEEQQKEQKNAENKDINGENKTIENKSSLYNPTNYLQKEMGIDFNEYEKHKENIKYLQDLIDNKLKPIVVKNAKDNINVINSFIEKRDKNLDVDFKNFEKVACSVLETQIDEDTKNDFKELYYCKEYTKLVDYLIKLQNNIIDTQQKKVEMEKRKKAIEIPTQQVPVRNTAKKNIPIVNKSLTENSTFIIKNNAMSFTEEIPDFGSPQFLGAKITSKRKTYYSKT